MLVDDQTDEQNLVRRAVNLFKFLEQAQQLPGQTDTHGRQVRGSALVCRAYRRPAVLWDAKFGNDQKVEVKRRG